MVLQHSCPHIQPCPGVRRGVLPEADVVVDDDVSQHPASARVGGPHFKACRIAHCVVCRLPGQLASEEDRYVPGAAAGCDAETVRSRVRLHQTGDAVPDEDGAPGRLVRQMLPRRAVVESTSPGTTALGYSTLGFRGLADCEERADSRT